MKMCQYVLSVEITEMETVLNYPPYKTITFDIGRYANMIHM